MAKKKKELESATSKAKSKIAGKIDEDYVDLSGSFQRNYDVINSGSVIINKVIGCGGIPRGRITEIFGPPSSGKCLVGDSLLFTPQQGIIKIEKLYHSLKDKPGPDSAVEYQEKILGKDGIKTTSHFYNGGVKKTKKIKSRYGYEVEGTRVHPILVMEKSGKQVWRKLKDVKKGDYICIQRNQQCFGKEYIKLDWEYKKESRWETSTKKYKIPTSIDEKLASFLAYVIAEGTTTYKTSMGISQKETEVANIIKKLAKSLFGKELVLKKESLKDYNFSSKQIRSFLYEALGVNYVKSNKKEIPDLILQSPKSVQQAFLRSYFEAEGSVTSDWVEISSASKWLVHQLQVMLLNLGIIANQRIIHNSATNSSNPVERDYYSLCLTGNNINIFAKEIGFESTRKTQKLDSLVKQRNSLMERSNVESIPYQKELVLAFKDEVISEQGTGRGGNFPRKGFKNVYGNNLVKRLEAIKYRGDNLSYLTWKRIKEQAPKEHQELNSFSKIERNIENQFFYDLVTEITESEAQVYDLTIPDGHNFTSNGIISHNTTLATSICIQAQREGHSCLYLDYEHAFDPSYGKAIGLDLDPNKFALYQPNFLEKGQELITRALATHTLVKSTGAKKQIPDNERGIWIDQKKGIGIGVPVVIIIDSVAALIPKKEYEGEHDTMEIGLLPRLLSRYLRKLVSLIKASNCAIVLVNQERTNIKMGPFAAAGPDYETTGGKAVKFYASVRLRLKLKKKEKARVFNEIQGTKEELPIQNVIKCTAVKNKVGMPYRTGDFVIRFGEGVDNVRSIVDIAINAGIINKGGAWFDYKSLVDEAHNFRVQGMEKVRDIVIEKDYLIDELQERLESYFNQGDKKETASDLEKMEDIELISEEYGDDDD